MKKVLYLIVKKIYLLCYSLQRCIPQQQSWRSKLVIVLITAYSSVLCWLAMVMMHIVWVVMPQENWQTWMKLEENVHFWYKRIMLVKFLFSFQKFASFQNFLLWLSRKSIKRRLCLVPNAHTPIVYELKFSWQVFLFSMKNYRIPK